MNKKILLFLSSILLWASLSAHAANVTLRVNMNYQISSGNFDPANSALDIAGTMNDWLGTVMTDVDEDGIYEATFIDIEKGTELRFKFRKGGNWNDYEIIGSDGDRLYTVVDEENQLEYWYNDQVAENIKFGLNMNHQIALGNFDASSGVVAISGSFNNYTTEFLLDNDNNGIYEYDAIGLVGSTISFTFLMNGNVQEAIATREYQVVEGDNVVSCWFNNEQNINKIDVMANSDSFGTVTGSGDYSYDEIATVSAKPNLGYGFLYWSRDGLVVSEEEEYTFVANMTQVLTANFEALIKPYLIELSNNTVVFVEKDTKIADFSTSNHKASDFTYVLSDGNGVNDIDNSKFYVNESSLYSAESLTTIADYNIHITSIEKEDKFIENEIIDFNGFNSELSILYSNLTNVSLNNSVIASRVFGKGPYDIGMFNYLRLYWQLQELTTDEVICAWGDLGIGELNTQKWERNEMYSEIFSVLAFSLISQCNEFINACSNNELSLTGEQIIELETMKAEARFLRALSYWHLTDLFGNIPVLDDTALTGDEFPEVSLKSDVLNYIDSELIDIVDILPLSSAYGKANKASAWTLLAKLQLNNMEYEQVMNYTGQIIDSQTHSLTENYLDNFLADNNTSPEIIFPILFDPKDEVYGGMTFVIYAQIGGNMNPSDYGTNGGWGGNRTTKAFVSNFSSELASDSRALFFTEGFTLEASEMNNFTSGYGVTKFRNVNSDGTSDFNTFVSTDFPMFRLADVYLMRAEAALGIGENTEALSYINKIRVRAGLTLMESVNIDDIFTERSRELYWEAHRRTDLIRFDKFTGDDYLWEWKGMKDSGTSTSSDNNTFTFPIFTHGNSLSQDFVITVDPATNITTNPSEDIKLYPNPATSYLIIDGAQGFVIFYNISGDIVLTHDLAMGNHIDISNLSKGVYIVWSNEEVIKLVKN